MTHAACWKIPIAVVMCGFALLVSANGNNRSPFAVLGVNPQTATQEEIKRRYRKLCLEYHPDKNQHLPPKKLEDCERKFKELQSAWNLIGTPQARNAYMISTKQQPIRNDFYNGYHSNDADFRHAFHARPRARRRPPFDHSSHSYSFFNVDKDSQTAFRNPSFNNSPNTHSFSSPAWNAIHRPDLWKSVYVQKVTVPLEDLYSGRPNFEFTLRENLWTRLVAALRGRIAYLLLGRALLSSIPTCFISRKMAACSFLYLFLGHLPQLPSSHFHDATTFTATLQPGYKGNTKLIFNDERTGQPGVEVHFILKEAKHPVYSRVGNNLHVKCVISPKQAAKGCHVEIPSLHDPDFRLEVAIPCHVSTGDRIVIPHKGWPNRKLKGVKGDLVVTILVSPFHTKKSS